jgi:Flp pilus assembly protein CpaB
MPRALRATRVVEAHGNGDVPLPASVSSLAPRERRPSWVILGVVMVGVAALVGAWISLATSEQVSVMVAARDLEPGEVIEATDLQVVELDGSNQVRAVQSHQQDLVVGLTARGPIPAGTVMNTGLVGRRDQVVPAGWAVVGASLERGAVPSENLAVGDAVDLLRTVDLAGVPSATAPPSATVISSGSVWSVRRPDPSSVSAETWVALLVPAETREDVVQAVAEGQLSLALMGDVP